MTSPTFGDFWSQLSSWFLSHRCPARECHSPHKCKGNLVDSFTMSHLEDCISACGDRADCTHYTLEKTNDHCLLYEDCNETFACDTCASGEKDCTRGYGGIEKRGF